MAIILKATYTERVSEHSTHQLALTLQTKVAAVSQIPAQSARLQALLKSCMNVLVEQESLGEHDNRVRSIGQSRGLDWNLHRWKCGLKQKQLLLRYLKKCHLDRSVIEQLALERFGKPLHTLRPPEAGKLIHWLHE